MPGRLQLRQLAPQLELFPRFFEKGFLVWMSTNLKRVLTSGGRHSPFAEVPASIPNPSSTHATATVAAVGRTRKAGIINTREPLPAGTDSRPGDRLGTYTIQSQIGAGAGEI